ncbi:MAG: hypothetical protein CMP34_00880 [Rickettsiales bacterium]|nr:hypothetical protein [Rickettsiales bacterium]|tara:strand:+ start:1821 stop:2534 length:714 start_codon:yes stop_codon:yes gene_type:complete
MKINEAMIFAAGFGKRMLPLTESKPKALLEVNKKSLLENHIDTLIGLGFINIVVNAFHLSEQIVEKIKKYDSRVNVIVEKEILETGGGLINAIEKKMLQPKPLILLNSDTFWINNVISPFELLLKKWDPESMDILLCLKNKNDFCGYNGKGDFNISNETINCSPISGVFSSMKFVFTGLQIFKPNLIMDFKKSKFSVKEVFYPLIKKKRIFGFIDKSSWFHISNPDDFKKIKNKFKK